MKISDIPGNLQEYLDLSMQKRHFGTQPKPQQKLCRMEKPPK